LCTDLRPKYLDKDFQSGQGSGAVPQITYSFQERQQDHAFKIKFFSLHTLKEIPVGLTPLFLSLFFEEKGQN
jgi:hypothetical protein